MEPLPATVPKLETRHLEALRAVADEGSFRAAADVLGYSQAAVSQQVAALESASGARLFDRPGGPRPVSLTPAGRLLLTHARVVLDRLDEARRDLDDLASGTAGRLAVGTFQSVSVELLPLIVGRMRTEAPNLKMRAVEEDENEPLLAGLHTGDLDVAFLAGPVGDSGVDLVELGTDPFVAVVPASSPFASMSAFPLRDGAAAGLVAEQHSSTHSYVEQHLRRHGARPRYVFRTNDNMAMQAMVRNGMGSAIMPQLAVSAGDPGVVVLPLDSPAIPRSILLALPRGDLRIPSAERFALIAREVGLQRLDPPAGGVSP